MGESSGPLLLLLLSQSVNVLQCEQCLVDILPHPQLKCHFLTPIVRLFVFNHWMPNGQNCQIWPILQNWRPIYFQLQPTPPIFVIPIEIKLYLLFSSVSFESTQILCFLKILTKKYNNLLQIYPPIHIIEIIYSDSKSKFLSTW